MFFSQSVLTNAGIVNYFVTLDLLSTSCTSSYSVIPRPDHAIILCYTPHIVDKLALNKKSAN